jgi:hypothetical protein
MYEEMDVNLPELVHLLLHITRNLRAVCTNKISRLDVNIRLEFIWFFSSSPQIVLGPDSLFKPTNKTSERRNRSLS